MAKKDIFSTEYTQESLGEDISLSPEGALGGDLEITASGDMGSVSGEENLSSSLIRRLVTPKGFLARYVEDITGLISINKDYGNGAFKYLSEPISSSLIGDIKEEIRICLAQEPRIQVQDIAPSIIPNNGFVQIFYNITYIVTGSDQMETLAFIQSPGQFEARV